MTGNTNPNYKGGYPHCKDCGVQLKGRKAIRCKPCFYKFHIRENNALWHPDRLCQICGKKITKYASAKLCRTCNNKSNFGEKNGRWIDGRSYLKYPKEFAAIRKYIRKRDNYMCCFCLLTEEQHFKKYGRNLDIHHIDHNKQNNSEDNLILICRKCHRNL
jgi:hypothetical protein